MQISSFCGILFLIEGVKEIDIIMDRKLYNLAPEDQLSFALYAASKELVKLYRPRLDELNLTYTQYLTMRVLWEHKRLNVKELGEKLYLDSGTLTPVLKSLEAKGYVRRTRSSRDERVLLVGLTKEGEALKETAAEVPEYVGAELKLRREEVVALRDRLDKMLDCMKET